MARRPGRANDEGLQRIDTSSSRGRRPLRARTCFGLVLVLLPRLRSRIGGDPALIAKYACPFLVGRSEAEMGIIGGIGPAPRFRSYVLSAGSEKERQAQDEATLSDLHWF